MTDRIDLAAIRARVAAATKAPWEVGELDLPGATPGELCVFAPEDPRSHEKSDGTWHACFIARGMDGPTSEPNADLIAHAPADLASLCDEVERLREIIAGRDRAPTDTEIEAHAAAGGQWLHADAEDGALAVCQDAWSTRIVRHRAGRWWALDASGAPCAWPVVTEVERG